MNWKKYGSIHSPRKQDQHFETQILNLWMNWEKSYPNQAPLLKIRWERHIKKDGHILNLTQIIQIFQFLKF